MMIGARLRTAALLAAATSVIACCLGSSQGLASPTAGALSAAGMEGPAIEAGPVTAPSARSAGAPIATAAVQAPGSARSPLNGSILSTTRVPGAAAGKADAAVGTQSYTNPWRYCPGDIQLGVSDGEGCDEWWLAASYTDSGTTHYGMDAVGAWQTTMGQGVTIGLLSSGADTNDPDYADNLASGAYNFVDGNTDANDTYGTGTVLTGIAAAEADNGGFVGVAPQSKVLEVKVLGPYGTLTDSAASQGITYAAAHGASVIAFPLYEIGPAAGYLPQTQSALNATAGQNIVVALASGDLGSTTQGVQNGTPGYLISPDGSQLPNTITAASEDYLNSFDQFTDSGTGVQIAAPGTSLFGDYPDNWPAGGWISGSESASTEVAAVAALLRSAFPTATATQVVQAILAGGRPLASLQGKVSCGCMLSASGALSALAQITHVAPVVHAPPAQQQTPTSPTYDNGSGAFWGDCSIPTTFNDPRADCEWYVPASYTETGYYGGSHVGVNLAAAWQQSTGAGVKVATVDTGAAANADFASQLVPGWNFWDNNSDTTDVVYHGTYTASLIAAQPNNGLGIVGAAPGATLEPVKVLGPNEEWVNSNIVAGLDYAVNAAGVRAVNISLAGLNSPVPGIQDAMQNAENKGVLLVFAAGNWGADHDNPQFVPSFDGTGFDNVLTVAATTHWNTIAFFSDYGPQHVDIAAPGEGIAMDTIDGSDTATSYGTSFAAPLVTGVAALLFSAYPQATAAQVKEAICDGATQLPQLMSKVRCGLLNAEGALQALAVIMDGTQTKAPSDITAPTTDAAGAPTVGQTVHATTGSWANSPTSYGYQWQHSTNGTTWTTASGSGATTSSYTVAPTDVGSYLRVTVTAANTGGSASASSSATGAVLPAPPAGGVPTITGTAQVGRVLTASPGSWTNSPTSYSYQWQTSANGSSGWSSASGSGATTSSYTVAAADLSDYLRVTVTATNAGGSASASSGATGAVLPAAPAGGVPTITGTAQVGQVLTANHGTWTNSPTSYGYQWQHSTNGTTWTTASGSGATTSSYTVASADAGTYLRVTVTATNAGGSASASSGATGVVPAVPDTTPPTVSVTSPANGSRVNHSSTVTITAKATDNRAVSKVLFYVNNVLKCTDTTASYSCAWAVPSTKGVKYTLTVRAYDSSNNTASASVSVTSK